jgi:hypothetical protein
MLRPSVFAVFEVDDQLNLGRLFDWQVARLRAFENLVDIDCGALDSGPP